MTNNNRKPIMWMLQWWMKTLLNCLLYCLHSYCCFYFFLSTKRASWINIQSILFLILYEGNKRELTCRWCWEQWGDYWSIYSSFLDCSEWQCSPNFPPGRNSQQLENNIISLSQISNLNNIWNLAVFLTFNLKFVLTKFCRLGFLTIESKSWAW